MHVTEITGITGEGAGVGRLDDGRVTFVHRTAPGDRVGVRVTTEKATWTRAELIEVLEPGPGRREAPCPHYDRCGGCTLEHLEYGAQLEAKATVVTDALQRIGGLEIAVESVVPSPRELRYRNRVTFTLRRTRGVVAGFHALDAPGSLVDITAGCLLPERALVEVWGALRERWGPEARRLPSGEELRLTLRSTREGAVALLVDGGYAPGRPEALVSGIAGLAAVWHRPEGARDYQLLAGEEALLDVWAGERVELRADVFTQVNRDAAEGLETYVVDRALASSPDRVLDGYGGVGLYGRRLAGAGVDVVAIEAHPGAVAEARRAAPAIRVLEGTVEARLVDALPVDVAILNPPRAGLDAVVTERLATEGPSRLVYVSCDPATLSRDLKRWSGVYEPVGIRCFDLFPQTAHVETVVELERCATT
jgi:23S rRNA (uracil1939-C5)-methyltransferase